MIWDKAILMILDKVIFAVNRKTKEPRKNQIEKNIAIL